MILQITTILYLLSFSEGKFLHRRDEPRDEKFENYLLSIADNLRKFMPVGIPALDLPVCDPLSIPDINEHVKESSADLNVQVKNLTVKGLTGFKIDKIKSSLQNLYLEINISVPSVSAEGIYSLNGTAFALFPLHGNGKARASINGLKLYVKALFQLGIPLKFTELKFDMGFTTMLLKFENLLGGGQWITYLQNMVTIMGPLLFKQFKPKIIELLNTYTLKSINKSLAENEAIKKIFGNFGK